MHKHDLEIFLTWEFDNFILSEVVWLYCVYIDSMFKA